MITVNDIPKEAKLITDSQELDELSLYMGFALRPEYGCAFVLLSTDGDYMAVWACESNVPELSKPVDIINQT